MRTKNVSQCGSEYLQKIFVEIAEELKKRKLMEPHGANQMTTGLHNQASKWINENGKKLPLCDIVPLSRLLLDYNIATCAKDLIIDGLIIREKLTDEILASEDSVKTKSEIEILKEKISVSREVLSWADNDLPIQAKEVSYRQGNSLGHTIKQTIKFIDK